MSGGNWFKGKSTICKKCGCTTVFWYKSQSGKWVLYDGVKCGEVGNKYYLEAHGGMFHDCKRHLEKEVKINKEVEIGNMTTDQKKEVIFNSENGWYYKEIYEKAPNEEIKVQCLDKWIKEVK